MESFYSSYQSLPTTSDYAWAEARANAARPGDEPEIWEKGLTMEEHVVVLQGQVSFLAGFVADLLTGQDWHTESELKMLDKIQEWGKE